MSLGQGLRVDILANNILRAVEDHWAANATPDDLPLPDRRYVAAGDPNNVAWDCEQLTVSQQGIGWGSSPDAGTPSGQIGSGVSVFGVRHVVYVVALVRCVPTIPDGNLTKRSYPTTAEMQLSGMRYMRDSGLLSQALVEMATRMRRDLGREGAAQAGMVTPVGADGGFVGAYGVFQVTTGELS